MTEQETWGITFSYATTQNGSYTALAELIDLEPPEPEVADIETSHALSTAKTRTYIGGMIEPGTANVKVNYDQTEFNTLNALKGSNRWFKVTWANGATLVWNGFLKKIGPKTPLPDGLTTTDLSFKVSGVVTFTVGS